MFISLCVAIAMVVGGFLILFVLANMHCDWFSISRCENTIALVCIYSILWGISWGIWVLFNCAIYWTQYRISLDF